MESLTSNIKDGQNGYPAENGYPGQNGRQVDPMPRSEAGKVVSEEVYWRDYYEHPDFNYEWNNGILEEKPMADVRNAAIYRWLLIVLESYLTVNPIAQLVNLEIGFRLPLPQKISIRKPDLFAVRNDNPVPLHDLDRNYMGIVDLAIESLSDSTMQEVERDTVHKKSEYEGVGVQEYYILDASRANMAFYHRTATGQYVPIVPVHGDVIRSTVLPGFQFRIRDLFQKPSLVELSHIPTYRQLILPEHQSALAQLDATSAKLDATSAQLDAERQKSARLLAKLRELGIAEDEL